MSTQQLVFEGPDPERLLLEAWGVHGTAVRISEPITTRKGGILGFFAKLHYRIEVLQEPAEPAEPGEPGEPGDSATSEDIGASCLRYSPLAALVEETEDLVELDTSVRMSFDAILEKVASSLGEDPSLVSIGATALPASFDEGSSVTPVHTFAPSEAAAAENATLQPSRWQRAPSPLRQDLLLVGFPLDLLDGAAEEPRSLEEAFALLEPVRALPRSDGSLIAVVGDLARASQLARILADELDVAPSEIAHALPHRSMSERDTHLVVHNVRQATDLSPGWRRDRIGLVAVGSVSPMRDAAWTRAILQALAPSATLTIASATTKAEDLASYCGAIGGSDGVLLEDLDHTLTPASVLSSGLRVARLDGSPAEANLWAAAASRALQRRRTRQ